MRMATNPITDSIIEGAAARLQIGWTQVNLAEDADGERCDPGDPDAVAWCALGAVQAAADALGYEDDVRRVRAALYRVAFVAGCADDDWVHGIEWAVSHWNDDAGCTQEDIVLAFKQALVSS